MPDVLQAWRPATGYQARYCVNGACAARVLHRDRAPERTGRPLHGISGSVTAFRRPTTGGDARATSPCRVRVPGASRRRGMESAGRMAYREHRATARCLRVVSSADPEKGWGIALGRAPASRTRQHRTGRARTATPLARACPRASAFPRWCRRRVRATQPVFRNVREAPRRQESATIAPHSPHGIAAKGSLPGAPPTRRSSDRGCALLEVPRHLETRQLAQRRG
jgi:hypothetical protein